MFKQSIDEVILEVEKNLYPTFATYVNQQLKESIDLGKIPSNTEIVNQYFSDDSENQKSGIYQYTLRITLEKILDVTIGNDNDRKKRMAAISNGISITVFEYGFDLLKTTIDKQLMRFLFLLLIPETIVFFSSMVLPILEIFISNKYLNKQATEKNKARS